MVFVDDAQVTEDVRGDWKEAGVEIRAYKVDEVGKYVGGVVKEVNGDKEKGKTKVKVLGSRECSWALSKVVEPVSRRGCTAHKEGLVGDHWLPRLVPTSKEERC